MSDSEDPIDLIDEGGDDLFGDEDDDQVTSPKDRVLDDDDLASDRDGDADGYNRYRDDGYQTQAETANKVVMGVQTFRHRIPKPQDGSVSNAECPVSRLRHPISYVEM
jgi:RNA polymerase-associated protein LEO1